MPGGVAFADVLEEKIGSIQPDGPVRNSQPTYRFLPPNPFLFVEPQRHFRAAYGSMSRATGASRQTRLDVPPTVAPAVAPAIESPRSTGFARQLTAAQQHALQELVELGASLGANFTASELRSAFRSLARRYHPDSRPASSAAEAARLSRIFASLSVHYRRLQAVVESSGTVRH